MKYLFILLPILLACNKEAKKTDVVEIDTVIQSPVLKKDLNPNEILVDIPIERSIVDLGPYKHELKIRGCQYVKNRHGVDSGAIKFNGTTDYLMIPYRKELHTNSFTMSIWVKMKDTPDSADNYSFIFGCFDPAVGEWGAIMWVKEMSVGGSIGAGRNNHLLITSESDEDSISIHDGKWHHMVLLYNDVTKDFEIYVDGRTGRNPNYFGAGDAFEGDDNIVYKRAFPWTIGALTGYTLTSLPTSHGFDGAVDDIRLYNYALTPEEVVALYNEIM